jgi:hypothetical protein
MRRWAFVGMAILLAGCATAAQQEATRVKDTIAREKVNIGNCTAQITASETYQALKDKLPPPDGSPPSMALQANTSKPTEQQVALLLDYHRDQLSPCRKVTLQAFANVHPAFVAIVAQSYAESDASYARLVRREISWGGFASDSYARLQATKANVSQMGRQLDGELAQAHQYEVQQRQAALSALSQWAYQQQVVMQNQQMINAMNRPVMTNCRYVGATLNCTSY